MTIWKVFTAPSKKVWRISASDAASLNRPRPATAARLMPAPSSNSRQRPADSACVMSTVSALNEILRARRPATVVKPYTVGDLDEQVFAFLSSHRVSFPLDAGGARVATA